MNRKIVVFHPLKERFSISYSVIMIAKTFYIMKDYFNKKNYEIYYPTDFIDEKETVSRINNIKQNLLTTDFSLEEDLAFNNFLKKVHDTDFFDNCFLIGVKFDGFNRFFIQENYDLLKSKNIKTVIWHDDLHEFNRYQKKSYNIPVTDYRLDKTDLILTPSKRYYENIISPYLPKTVQFFYGFNQELFPQLKISNFKKKKKKIILSGSFYEFYPIRVQLKKYHENNKNTEFSQLIDVLQYPSRSRQSDKNKDFEYYKILNKYQGAFFGFARYPLNFPLAKIIEILACGTLGFFEPNPVLKELGLEPFVHYVPIKLNRHHQIIPEANYYKKYLGTDEGMKIALTGCRYVRWNFNLYNKVDELINLLQKMNK